MIGCRMELKNGIYFVVGSIDEHADFRELQKAKLPLKVDFSGVSAVNSLGVRAFVEFMDSIETSKLEFHCCSIPMVEMLNCFPGTLGEPGNPGIVKSLFCPYECLSCGHQLNQLITVHSARPEALPELKPTRCGKCGQTSKSLYPEDDLFSFILAGD